MNVNKTSLFWGLLLIIGGGVALAQQFGYMDQLPESVWMWVFALISLLALVSCLTRCTIERGWLLSAGDFDGQAGTVAFGAGHVFRAVVGSTFFFGLMFHFVAA